jgi:hypothetical protein
LGLRTCACLARARDARYHRDHRDHCDHRAIERTEEWSRGAYSQGWFEGTGEAIHGDRRGCQPLHEPTSSAHDYFNNQSTPLIVALAARVPRVWLLRIWAETVPRWQDHFGHGLTKALRSMLDCTHYCLPGSVLEQWSAKLVHAIISDGVGYGAARG